MKLSSFLFLFLVLTLFSCKSLKNNQKQIIKKNNISELLIDSVLDNNFKYSTFYSKSQVKFVTPERTTKLQVSIKAKNNDIISINLSPGLGISVADIYFTKDSLYFFNHLSNKYSIYSYNFINSIFSLSFDFNTVENILFGNLFFFPDNNSRKNYIISNSDSLIKLSNNFNVDTFNINHNFLINKSLYKVKNCNFIANKNVNFDILYDNFKLIENIFLCHLINVNFESTKNNFDIFINHKKIYLNKNLSINIKIPKNYTYENLF